MKGKRDANLNCFAHRSRGALLLGRKLQQRRAFGWRGPHGAIHVSQHGALETAADQ
jgi:hypothetical protein